MENVNTRIWLIRHGEPDPSVKGRCYGSLDVELSPHGRAQMEAVARALKDIDAVVTSPLRRAHQSAQILAERWTCPLAINPGFREIDFGDFEGLTYDEIAARFPEPYRQWMEHPATVTFPNGENFATLHNRATEAFASVTKANAARQVAIVTHGGPIRAIIAAALHIPNEFVFRIAQDVAAVNLITLVEGVPIVSLLNHHLSSTAQITTDR